MNRYVSEALREIREANAPKLFGIAEKLQAITKNIDLRSMGVKEAK